MFYLKLKGMKDDARHCYYSYLEENMGGGWFMETEKFKYAEEYETYQEALDTKNDWDDLDSFEIVEVESW